MGPGEAAGRPGFVHELALAGPAEEIGAVVAPFVQESRAAGAPTVLCAHPETTAVVLDLVGASPDVRVLAVANDERRASTNLRMLRALLPGHLAGEVQVRVVMEAPPAAYAEWHEWRRYEAAANRALADLDIWGLCVYERHRLTARMVDDLEATHPVVARDGAHRDSGRYQDPATFARRHFDAPPDPLERTAPALELPDPAPAAARAEAATVAARSGLAPERVECLVFATNEAVTNAVLHGRPPVHLRLWSGTGRVVVTVTDTGSGPADPFVGLVPPARGQDAGRGLWLAHQLVDVTHRRHERGYTVCLAAGDPPTRRHG